ncbi:MAG: hypothetical protein WAQ25_03100 [Candidatus Saccharimonas sp.]
MAKRRLEGYVVRTAVDRAEKQPDTPISLFASFLSAESLDRALREIVKRLGEKSVQAAIYTHRFDIGNGPQDGRPRVRVHTSNGETITAPYPELPIPSAQRVAIVGELPNEAHSTT